MKIRLLILALLANIAIISGAEAEPYYLEGGHSINVMNPFANSVAYFPYGMDTTKNYNVACNLDNLFNVPVLMTYEVDQATTSAEEILFDNKPIAASSRVELSTDSFHTVVFKNVHISPGVYRSNVIISIDDMYGLTDPVTGKLTQYCVKKIKGTQWTVDDCILNALITVHCIAEQIP